VAVERVQSASPYGEPGRSPAELYYWRGETPLGRIKRRSKLASSPARPFAPTEFPTRRSAAR
jgi:hypothetical protein